MVSLSHTLEPQVKMRTKNMARTMNELSNEPKSHEHRHKMCVCCFNVSPTKNSAQHNLYSAVLFLWKFWIKRKVRPSIFFVACLALRCL